MLTFWPHYGAGIDSASNRNEYQKYFLWGKDGRCVGLTTLPPSCAECLQSVNISNLEATGPVPGGTGIIATTTPPPFFKQLLALQQ